MEFILGDAIKGLVGGLLIGCSAAILLLANGRIAGISGIAGALITKSATKLRFENLAFVLGLITAPPRLFRTY